MHTRATLTAARSTGKPYPASSGAIRLVWILGVVAVVMVVVLAVAIRFQLRYGPIGGEDLLARAGFESDSDVQAVEYYKDAPVADPWEPVTTEPPLSAGTWRAYRLTRSRDDALIDNLCRCLRHFSRVKYPPKCWVPMSFVAIEGARGRRAYVLLVDEPRERIVWADICHCYSPQLYRRLERIAREGIGACEREWHIRTQDTKDKVSEQEDGG